MGGYKDIMGGGSLCSRGIQVSNNLEKVVICFERIDNSYERLPVASIFVLFKKMFDDQNWDLKLN